MFDTAAHLIDRVLPHVPIRQWVLSLPLPIRPMLAYDSELSRATLTTFLRVVFSWYRRQAKALGIQNTECGSVTAIQRFGSALNLNVHYHVLVLDGVFQPQTQGPPRFRTIKAPTTEDIVCVTRKIQTRVVRLFKLRGLFDDDHVISCNDQALVASYAASARGRIGLGENTGKLHARLMIDAPMQVGKENRASHNSGFDLHANVCVKAHERQKLERLCRYILRPPLAKERLKESADGHLVFEMKRPFSDGTTHLIFQPLEFIEKLLALIPRPRAHQVLYHGILAPHAKHRSQVIPKFTKSVHPSKKQNLGAPQQAQKSETRRRRLTWAECIKRVFAIDILKCAQCGSSRTIFKAITQPKEIHEQLTSLGLPTQTKRQHPPRAPPQNELCFP